MAIVKFEIEVEAEEVLDVKDALKDIVQDFGFPAYELEVTHEGGTVHTYCGGSKREIINLPPVREIGWDEFAKLMGLDTPWSFDNPEPEGLLDIDVDLDDEDETDPHLELPILPGAVVELANGLVYQVFSIDATGRVILDELEELTDEECEDEFLCGPPPTRH